MNAIEDVPTARQFRAEYAAQRAAEGRAYTAAELDVLPYLATGPLARQWSVRARSYEMLARKFMVSSRTATVTPLRVLDLGAGCAWLCYRASLNGHVAVALDIRDDTVDGLGAAAHYLDGNRCDFTRVAGTFEALPFTARYFDIAVFNASIHYATDLSAVLNEAVRVVRPAGRIVILDSPFYAEESAGRAMLDEKRDNASTLFGNRAATLMAPSFVEFLTVERLESVETEQRLTWRRHRVRYPTWYEMRPVVALLRGQRPPSRFDLWECTVR